MAKKQKRQVSRSATPIFRERDQSVVPVEAVSSSPRASYTRSAPTASDFNPDYSYVRGDLKRIAILAGSFITILVILSFFLR